MSLDNTRMDFYIPVLISEGRLLPMMNMPASRIKEAITPEPADGVYRATDG